MGCGHSYRQYFPKSEAQNITFVLETLTPTIYILLIRSEMFISMMCTYGVTSFLTARRNPKAINEPLSKSRM